VSERGWCEGGWVDLDRVALYPLRFPHTSIAKAVQIRLTSSGGLVQQRQTRDKLQSVNASTRLSSRPRCPAHVSARRGLPESRDGQRGSNESDESLTDSVLAVCFSRRSTRQEHAGREAEQMAKGPWLSWKKLLIPPLLKDRRWLGKSRVGAESTTMANASFASLLSIHGVCVGTASTGQFTWPSALPFQPPRRSDHVGRGATLSAATS
jgi:hypothetical protein